MTLVSVVLVLLLGAAVAPAALRVPCPPSSAFPGRP